MQRRYAGQEKDSKRRQKTRRQIAKLHNQVSDSRQDFLHKLSTKIINENQVIVLSDLKVSAELRIGA